MRTQQFQQVSVSFDALKYYLISATSIRVLAMFFGQSNPNTNINRGSVEDWGVETEEVGWILTLLLFVFFSLARIGLLVRCSLHEYADFYEWDSRSARSIVFLIVSGIQVILGCANLILSCSISYHKSDHPWTAPLMNLVPLVSLLHIGWLACIQ
jgi:hypothetical protein